MALIVELKKEGWEQLPDAIKELYQEKDGTYTLEIEGLEDTSGLKSALEKERANVKERDKKIKAWETLGKTPEEIAALLKPEVKPEVKPAPSPTDDQYKTLQKEIAELRKGQAETAAREKRREWETRVSKMFDGYTDDQKADFMLLVGGETDEEIAASVKAIKERYPVAEVTLPPVGGRTNPTPKGASEGLKNSIKAMAKEAKEHDNGLGEWKGI